MSQLDLDTLQPRIPIGQIWKGTVAQAPLNFAAALSILIPDMNPTLVFHNVRWQARDAFTLPQVDDDVLVVFDNQQEPWVIAWWPGVNPDPFPVQNGKFLKGVAGDAVWSPLAAYGTSLPASPLDGDEAILVDSVTNPTYQWRFRYNAGSASAYKWELVGGTSVHASASSGAWQNITQNVWSGAAGMTVPRAGVYRVIGGGQVGGSPAAYCIIGVLPGTPLQVAGDHAAGGQSPISISDRVTSAAGAVVQIAFTSPSTGQQWANSWAEILPVRVS